MNVQSIGENAGIIWRLLGDYSKAKAENGTTKKSRKKQDCRTEISIPLSDGWRAKGN